MTHDEAIQTIRETRTFEELKESLINHTEWKSEYVQAAIIMLRKIFKELAALDSLAVESSDDAMMGRVPNEAIQALMQEEFNKRPSVPEAVEPSEDAREFAQRIRRAIISDKSDQWFEAEITARDERIRREAVKPAQCLV